MMKNEYLEKYAELIVRSGINIEVDQILVVNSPIECAYFTRVVAEKAFEAGALDVVISWNDEQFTKIRYVHGKEEIFDTYPSYLKELYDSYVKKGAAFLTISASDPELMQGVSTEKMARFRKASNEALLDYRERLLSNKNVWCIVSVPTRAWAMKVFKDVDETSAVTKLWQNILKAVRVDQDNPVEAWNEHKNNLKKRINFLSQNNFKYLKYKNSIGTDLKIELPQGHLWLGGSDFTDKGIEFIANMPTEEVFTMPHRKGVDGTVVSSMPLNYNGNLIDKFSLTFKEGEVVSYTAEKGYDVLKSILEADEGAKYLGEVALVPYDSPISNLKLLFLNTLYDENASCHLALGAAYPITIRNGENMTREELEANGGNYSLTHVDFMIGTSDLEIIGTTQDNREVQVFKNGNFCFE